MKIYTRTGDNGETALVGGTRVSKAASRVAAYGDVDELSASLGVARAQVEHPEIRAVLEEVQRDLFSAGALLADPDRRVTSEKVSLEATDVERLEQHIDRFDSQLPSLRSFVLPGGSPGGALLHQARAVCRRAERRVVGLGGAERIPASLVPYLNRLSDLLFVLARLENQHRGVEDIPW